jgi:hypothetical protein
MFDATLSAISAGIGDSTTMVSAMDVAQAANWQDCGLNRSTVEKVQAAQYVPADGTYKLGYQLDADLELSTPLPNGTLPSAQHVGAHN